jgi:hypothetical protein
MRMNEENNVCKEMFEAARLFLCRMICMDRATVAFVLDDRLTSDRCNIEVLINDFPESYNSSVGKTILLLFADRKSLSSVSQQGFVAPPKNKTIIHAVKSG